jgi:hypothetical protein
MTTHGMTRRHHQFSVKYIREQELIAWALIIVILVISVMPAIYLWAKANGTV